MGLIDNDFAGMSALVVEDVSSMRQLLVRLLQEIGFDEVIHSEDGAEALKRIESATRRIDVVLCDLEMPIINGIEFIEMLRRSSSAEVANVPVIVVTGYSEEKNLRKAVRAGVHGFLVKPISRKALETRVRRAFKHGRIDASVFGKKPGEIKNGAPNADGDDPMAALRNPKVIKS